MRGWSLVHLWKYLIHFICPAYAGMILDNLSIFCIYKDLSRVCGDDPFLCHIWNSFAIFVPRMRGWSYYVRWLAFCRWICPAYAGMILIKQKKIQIEIDLSRVCGGDPGGEVRKKRYNKFVPRMRGWSWRFLINYWLLSICPAYAGVIPNEVGEPTVLGNLSRVCGGDPERTKAISMRVIFVPRMRGWFYRRAPCL